MADGEFRKVMQKNRQIKITFIETEFAVHQNGRMGKIVKLDKGSVTNSSSVQSSLQ